MGGAGVGGGAEAPSDLLPGAGAAVASAGRSGRRPGLKELCPQGRGPAKAPSSHSTPGTPGQGLPRPSDCGPPASRGLSQPRSLCPVLLCPSPLIGTDPESPANKPSHHSRAGLLPREPAACSLFGAGAAQPLLCGCSCPNSCCDPWLCCEHELGLGTQSPRKPPGGRRVKAGGERGERAVPGGGRSQGQH